MALLNSQYDTIMRHYDEIRDRHRSELDARILEISRTIPEISKLDQEVAHSSVQAARARIADPGADLSLYYKRLEEIAGQRILLLKEHGYPADYLEMKYDCPRCRDTGYSDGQRCSCFLKEAADLLSEGRDITSVLEKENFSHFQLDYYSDRIRSESTGKTARETAEDAMFKAIAFIEKIGEPDNHLLIYGDTGVGKTYLSHCILAEAMARKYATLYFTAYDFFEIMADAKFTRSNGQETSDAAILSSDLLIIDDLGTELGNSFTASSLFRVVNERILSNKSTIISTNLMPDELSDRYTERITSRIFSHYSLIKLIGEDIRIQLR